MKLPIHANVTCHDGIVGKSSHIIVDLVTEQATHFVIKTDHDHKEYVVPIASPTSFCGSTIYLANGS